MNAPSGSSASCRPAPLATDVAFHVGGSLDYPGDWPSGAAASVTVDPEVRFEGAAPQLAVSTPPETVQLGATRPAAARLLELTIGAAGIPADGTAAAALTVNGQQSDGRYGGYPQALLLDGPAANDPTRPSSRPPLLQPGGDPFVGCPIGEPCTRHVLVTFLASADPVSIQWSATLARADVVDAWTSPADLSAMITKAWDVDAAAKASRVHLEGDLTISGGPWPQAGVQLQTRTTSDDPYAPFLPVPGWLTVGVTSNAAPAPSGEATAFVQVSARQPGQAGGGSAGQMAVRGGQAEIEFNPMGSGTATCQVGERCPLVVVGVTRERRTHGVRVLWHVPLDAGRAGVPVRGRPHRAVGDARERPASLGDRGDPPADPVEERGPGLDEGLGALLLELEAVASMSIPASRNGASTSPSSAAVVGSAWTGASSAPTAWSVSSGIVSTVDGAASPRTYSSGGADGSLTPVLANSSRCGRAPFAIRRCQRSEAKNAWYST